MTLMTGIEKEMLNHEPVMEVAEDDTDVNEMRFESELHMAVCYILTWMEKNKGSDKVAQMDADYLASEAYDIVKQEIEAYR